MLQRHAGVAGLPMASEEGWAKTCATLPWPIRGWSLQVVFFLLRRSPREGSGCQGGTQGAAMGRARRRPGLDAGASAAYIAALSSRKNRSGQMQARGRPPRLPAPDASPAMGSLPPRPAPQHRARQATDARQPGGAHHPGLDATEQRTTRPPEASVRARPAPERSSGIHRDAALLLQDFCRSDTVG